jgi:hypothetical protein
MQVYRSAASAVVMFARGSIPEWGIDPFFVFGYGRAMLFRRVVSGLFFCVTFALFAGCGGDDVAPPVDGGSDAASLDGGPDGGPRDGGQDGGHDAGPVCGSDAECSDDLFCTGTETCDPASGSADERGCVAGASPCTGAETCDEVTDSCVDCTTVDVDGDGESACTDCDDNDNSRRHGATEICDDNDEDCDPTTLGADVDGDTFVSTACCNGAGNCGTDCNDTPVSGLGVHQGAIEVCNGIDDNCSGAVDEDLPVVSYYPDCDGDGQGDAAAAVISGCAAPAPPTCAGGVWVGNNNDCNDADPSIYRGAADFCDDTVDSDCLPGTAGSPVLWYRDADDDGYYDGPVDEISGCTRPAGHARTPGDCNDADPTAHPGAPERCDNRDNDCDGLIDDVGADGFCAGLVANATAVCRVGACVVDVCFTSYGNCNVSSVDGCETDLQSAAANCGTCGHACPFGANSTPACTASACSILCASGYQDCNGAPADGCEVDFASPDSCGGCTTVCPTRPNATRTCASSTCGYACAGDYRDCNGTATDGCEVDRLTDAANCGTCGHVCPTVANGAAVCAAAACGTACNAGYVLRTGACVAIAPPRQISPLSTSTATSQRPTFTWVLPAGTDGAHVEICARRDCATVLTSFDVTGTSGAPAAALTAGTKYWRLFGRSGTSTGLVPSFTWQVLIGARTAAHEGSFGSVPDFNGDGFADIAVTSNAMASRPGTVYLYNGRASGPPTVPSQTLTGTGGVGGYFGGTVISAGDVNGDGFGDLLVGAPGVGRAYVYFGGSSGLPVVPSATLADGSTAFGRGSAAIGDANGDGYADVLVGEQGAGTNLPYAQVFLGSASGPSSIPSATLVGPITGGYYGYTMTGGDLNGDGLGDAVVGAMQDTGGGRAYVYLGVAGVGLSASPAVTLIAPAGGGFFGVSLAHIDLDGDGYGDLVIGNGSVGTGRIYVYNGSSVGVSATPSATRSAPADGTVTDFGTRVANGGDVNGDGYADLFTSNCYYPDSGPDRQGRAYAYYGSAVGLSANPNVTLPNLDGANAYFGIAGGGADFDGDGNSDFVVGSYATDLMGRVHVYRGAVTGLSATPTGLMTGTDGVGAYFSYAIAP